MLYMTAGDVKIIILETGNLEEIKKGRPAHMPDNSVMIAWTPDPVWLADKIMESNGDGALIGKYIDEASKRPQKPTNRPHHNPHCVSFPLGEKDG